jgi:hypothetical protein
MAVTDRELTLNLETVEARLANLTYQDARSDARMLVGEVRRMQNRASAAARLVRLATKRGISPEVAILLHDALYELDNQDR